MPQIPSNRPTLGAAPPRNPGRPISLLSRLPAAAHALATAGRGYHGGPNPSIQPPPKPLQPVARPRSQSVSQVANNQVNQQLAPVLASQDAQSAQQNQAMQSFALALLGKLQPVAGQVGGDYDRAIGQTAALSGAAADALRSANPNQQDQQLLSALNAPEAQQQQVAGDLANTFGLGAGVTLFNQGAVPGGQLASDKAAAQFEARQLPGLAALKGQQDLASAMLTQRNARQATLAQRPALVQQATQTIKGNIAGRQAAAYDRYKFETARNDALVASGQKTKEQAARDQANLDYKYTALKERADAAATTAQATRARSDRSYSLQFAKTYGYNPETGQVLPGYKISKNGRVVKAGTGPGGAKIPQLSAKQRQDYMGLAATIAENAHNGFTTTDKAGTPTVHPAIGYRQALDEMDKEGIPRPIAIAYLNRYYPKARPATKAKTVGPSRKKGDLGAQVAVPPEPATPGRP